MRHELADHEWTAIKPMLPNKPRGVPRVNDRRVLNGIFWVLRSGAPWRDLPTAFGPYTTCYNRFVRRRRARCLGPHQTVQRAEPKKTAIMHICLLIPVEANFAQGRSFQNPTPNAQSLPLNRLGLGPHNSKYQSNRVTDDERYRDDKYQNSEKNSCLPCIHSPCPLAERSSSSRWKYHLDSDTHAAVTRRLISTRTCFLLLTILAGR